MLKINFSVFLILAAVLAVAFIAACGGGMSSAEPRRTSAETTARSASAQQTAARQTAASVDAAGIYRSLDELAELERSGSWFQGMALAESGIRESAGDFAGATAAAYKELSWAYGKGLIQKEDVERGLQNVLALKDSDGLAPAGQISADVSACAGAILAFSGGRWAAASAGLGSLFDELEEPDSFARWMILVCALEGAGGTRTPGGAGEDRRAAAAYKAIRARYTQFPEYWYRGARAFSGLIAAEYAENCINTAPQGPFAGECRNILAVNSGLKSEDGASIKTKTEIENVISQSLNTGDPGVLGSLFPLISLPDNPYTVYAVSALRALTSVRQYRDYFSSQAAASAGRLAERLSYLSRS